MKYRFTYEEWQAEVARRKREKWAQILVSEPPGRAVGRRPRDPEKEEILLEMDRARLARQELEHPPMPWRPEQQQALDYLRRKGTDSPAEVLRERVARALEEIEELLEGLPEDLAGRRPTPDRWSVHEVVDHLVESHRPAVSELKQLLAGVSPPSGPITAGLLSPNPLRRDFAEVTAELQAIHRDLLAALSRADDATPVEARAKVEMVVRCAKPEGGTEPVHWIDRFDWKAYALLVAIHTREHADQIRRTHSGTERP